MKPVIKRLTVEEQELARGRPLGWIISTCPHCNRKFIKQVAIDSEIKKWSLRFNGVSGASVEIYPANDKKLLTLKEAKAKLKG